MKNFLPFMLVILVASGALALPSTRVNSLARVPPSALLSANHVFSLLAKGHQNTDGFLEDLIAIIEQWPKTIEGIIAAIDVAQADLIYLLLETQLIPKLEEILAGAVAEATQVVQPITDLVKALLELNLGIPAEVIVVVGGAVALATLVPQVPAILQNLVAQIDQLVDGLVEKYTGRIQEILRTLFEEIWVQLEPLADLLRPIFPGIPGGDATTNAIQRLKY